jgi:hypothetical protein
MINISPIAAAHGIETEALQNALVSAGWDFSALEVNPEHVAFATKIIEASATRIADAKAKRAAREAKAAAVRTSSMTAAAKARPELTCGRCDGKGHIRGFGHVANGVCFACSGAGIRRRAA